MNLKNYMKNMKNKTKVCQTIKARDLWYKILNSQIETGTPYMLYKDACNKKSNQKNVGTIKSSNLCCEIVEYSDSKETAVCNLASIALGNFVKEPEHGFSNVKIYTKDNCNWCRLLKALLLRKKIKYKEIKISKENFKSFKEEHKVKTVPQLYNNNKLVGGYLKCLNILRSYFDYNLLHKITKIVTENLNKVIDINFYPTKKTKCSNLKHRPIGIGVQGLADAFAKMDIPFHSENAKNINKFIFETMYHAALEKSMELSKINGSYSSFIGCPASQGILQFDMWNIVPAKERYDWADLKNKIKIHGLRNSLLLAPMPTASTSTNSWK